MGGRERIFVVFSTLRDLKEVERISQESFGNFRGSFFNQSWKAFLRWVDKYGLKNKKSVSALFVDETQILRFEKRSSAQVLEEMWKKSI